MHARASMAKARTCMKSSTRLALTLWLTLIGGVSLMTPVSAQKTDAAARSAEIAELSRAGKYSEAIPLAQRLLADMEKAHGPDHRDVAVALNNLALLYGNQGRDAEAEPLYQRALSVMEKAFGPNSAEVGANLSNLAALYQRQQRHAEAEPLFKRSLANRERKLGGSHPDVAQSLNNLATHYQKQQRYAEAEPLFRRALAIYEKALGPEHPAVATVLNNLGQVAKDRQRPVEAEPLIKRSLAIREKVLGPDHPDVARSLNNLADLYDGLDARKAEQLFERALAVRERAVGPDHPDTARSLNNLALFEADTGYPEKALPLALRLIASGRGELRAVLPVLSDAKARQLVPADKSIDLALDAIQRGTQSSAASAVTKLAVRLAAGTDRLAELVRRDQDLAAESEVLNKALVAAVSRERPKRDLAAEQRAKARLAAISTERPSLQKTLAAEFPDYAALSNPLPMTVKEIQSLLSDDEAMALFAVTVKDSFVVAITRGNFDWKPIGRGSEGLSGLVADFRRGLDVANASDATGKSSLFNLEFANWLYQHLLGSVEPLVKDKRGLLIVPSGALTALPFHLLVTEKPPAAIPEKLEGYRDAAWLLKRHAVSVLPSVASLKSLRAVARRDFGVKPMTGFGDPLFNPAQEGLGDRRTPARSAARGVTAAAYTDFWRGAGVDRAALGRALPQLPDTADELNAVAKSLGVAASEVHLGSAASEAAVKRAPLADYGIVYFATHGLVAGDVKGLAEPSLALSLPKQPTELDDGLLTASESGAIETQRRLGGAVGLQYDCRRPAGCGSAVGPCALVFLRRSPRAAGLALGGRFGSRHPARHRYFDRLSSEPKIGRAEALRQAMLAYLADPSSPKNAYPAFWGPFALIGEGASR